MCASMCHKRRDTNYNVDCPNIKNIITHPAPHQYAHQGAGTGTIHDPGHGGIT